MGYYTKISAVDTKNGRVIAELFDRKILGYVADSELYEAIGFMCMNSERPLDVRNINSAYYGGNSFPAAFYYKEDLVTFIRLLENGGALEYDYKDDLKNFFTEIENYKIDNNIFDCNIQYDIDCYG